MEIVFLVVLVAGGAAAWWWLSRRRRELLAATTPDEPEPGPPEVFTRDALVNRPRRFDPGAWDDSAEPAAPPATGAPQAPDRPAPLDRDFLTRRDPGASRPLMGEDAEVEDEPRFLDRDFLERKARRSTQDDPPAGS